MSATSTLDNCIIIDNTSDIGGGLYCAEASNVTVNNCTFENNFASSSGGAVICDFATLLNIENSILWNDVPQEISIYGTSVVIVNYSDVQGGYTGTGNIDTDPFFIDPEEGDYHLQSIYGSYHGGAWLPDLNHSPCIDAGDPASPYSLEPIPNGERVNMGAYGNTEEASLSFDPNYPDMIVELTYVSGSPVSIGGGNIFFEVFAENQDSIALNLDAWIDISYEGGTPWTSVFRSFSNYQPGWMINRPDMWYPIDAGYPAGNYTMTGKVGVFPDTVWDASGFPFEKLGDNHSLGFIPYHPDAEFPNPFDEITKPETGIEIPSEFAIFSVHPNPFNPSTTIRYTLPEASEVHLSVYDIQGQLVSGLVNSLRKAGYHEVTWNAEKMASGVYLLHLQTGNFHHTKKIVMLK